MKNVVRFKLCYLIQSLWLITQIGEAFTNATCSSDSIYLATSWQISGTLLEDTLADRILVNCAQPKMAYDQKERRIVYYSANDTALYSIGLQGGNDSWIKNLTSPLRRFTFDYLARTIYYISDVNPHIIKTVNMITSRENIIAILNIVLEDIAIDVINKWLVILGNGMLKRYYVGIGKKLPELIIYARNIVAFTVDTSNGALYWIEERTGNWKFYEVFYKFRNETIQTIHQYSEYNSTVYFESRVRIATGKEHVYILISSMKILDYFDKKTNSYLGRLQLSQIFQELVVADDINECACKVSPCNENSLCVNYAGSYECKCYPGFIGPDCVDVDECTSGVHNCHYNAKCQNAVASFFCSCNTGYIGNGVTCEDVNECEDGTHNCHSNGQCLNNRGSFICCCNAGYVGDGVSCKDIDECDAGIHNCHVAGQCTNTIGSFACSCGERYAGDGITCEAVENQQLLLRINEPYQQSLSNKSSEEYKDITGTITKAISEVYSGNEKYYGIEIVKLSNGSIIAEMRLMFKSPNAVSLVLLVDAVRMNNLENMTLDANTKKAMQVLFRGNCGQSPCPLNSECGQYAADYVICPCSEGYYFNGIDCEAYIDIDVEITVKGLFTEEFRNTESTAYINYTSTVADQLRVLFKNDTYFEDVLVTDLRNGSVVIDFVVRYRSPPINIEVSSRKVLVARKLNRASSKRFIGNLELVGKVLIKEPPPVPENITFEKNTNTLLVKWEKPKTSEYFSITHYVISYKIVLGRDFTVREVSFGASDNFLMNDLESSTYYVIVVHAKNKIGDGDRTEEFFVKTEKKSDSDTVVLIVVVTVISVLILYCVIIVMYLRYRKRGRHVTGKTEIVQDGEVLRAEERNRGEDG